MATVNPGRPVSVVPQVITREQPPAAPVWHVRVFERDNPKNNCLGYLGEQVPTPAGGGGGYENVVIPKSTPVSVWRNKPDLTFSFEIIFSGFTSDLSVMDDVTTLWRMYSPAEGTAAPPVVKFNAAGKLLPFEGADWWISDLEWGDAEANAWGDRTLQRMTVHLTEYRPDVQILPTRRHQWPATVKITSKTMTLSWIAKHYKVPGGWKAIGKIQHPPIKDPRKVKVGQTIRMP